jgi:NAD(P)-dependent dehydrogenase (short-subunit alcohol dehydrogenase family)
MRLSGQTVVVTGAGRGIGLAIARELARHGCHVGMVARSRTDLEKAAASVNEAGNGRAVPYPADVRDLRAVAAVVTAVQQELGPITGLVNNAGTPGPAGDEWTVDPEAWWDCIESTVRGSFNCIRTVVPGMIERGHGRVINVASVTGTTPWPLISATSTAKTALIRQTENLATAGSTHGLRVFALHPGMVRTDLLLSYRSDARLGQFLDNAPDGAFAPPELAGAVAARILAGDLDALSGRFVDVNTDFDDLTAHRTALTNDTLTLRLVMP